MKKHPDRFDLMWKAALDTGIPKNALCLDIGCGEGYFCGFLLNKGFDVIGVDLEKRCVKITWNKLKNEQSFQVIRADAQHLPFLRTEIFDFIICAEVIEHLSSPCLLLKGVASTLKIGGKLLVSTPNAIGLWSLVFDRLAGWIRNLVLTASRKSEKYRSGHISLFTYAFFKETLRRFNFVIERDLERWRSEGLLIGICLRESFLRYFGVDLCRHFIFNLLQRAELNVSKLFPKHLQSGWIFLCSKPRMG